MLALMVTLYGTAAALALALLVFPAWRARLQTGLRKGARRIARAPADWAQAAQRGASTAAGGLGRGARIMAAAHAVLARHRRHLALTALLLVLPAATLWTLRGHLTLDGYDDAQSSAADEHVARLLHGEQLVPPPPLPPEVFVTAEVQALRPELATADRKWALMDPDFVQRLLLVFKIMREQHGYEMALLEGWRSPERQAMLAGMGEHVTRAGAWQSWHQYGLAADCAFLRGGRLVISERDPWAMRGYELYGQVAESVGLTWGGRWKMMDLGHVEWRRRDVRLGQPAAAGIPRNQK
ncbi:MAG: M15 family metallopeptidase [Burkholderiales bacterium]|nr:M15 family metallopeptidase [Burkholderiales bacterium]